MADELALPRTEQRVEFRGGALTVCEWGDPDGPIVVALHGFLDHAWSWDGFVGALGDDLRVISFSARGHAGASHADAYGWIDFVADAVAVITTFADRPVHLLAHSWGAHLGAEVALRFPALVASMVNLDGLVAGDRDFEAPRPLLERVADRRRQRAEPPRLRAYPSLDAMVARRQSLTPRVPPATVASFVANGARHDDDGWRWDIDPLLLGRRPWSSRYGGFDITHALAALPCPLLLLTGDAIESPALTPDRSGAADLARRSHVRHIQLDDAGHYLHLERPADVATLAREFWA